MRSAGAPMTTPMLVNLSSLLDEAKCFDLVRQHRWPDGVRCPHCRGAVIARDGHDDTQRHRQRYRCKTCDSRFDDLTGTVLAGPHQPRRVWVRCLYVMGLTLSNCQIAQELDLAGSEVQVMTEQLRTGITTTLPPGTVDGDVEADESYVIAGHKGNPAAVAKKGVSDGGAGSQARPAAARWTRKHRQSSV
jgi:transposase-like protein